HSPQIANSNSLPGGSIGFIDNVVGRESWNHGLVVARQLLFQFDELVCVKKILNLQESVLLEFEFAFHKIHSFYPSECLSFANECDISGSASDYDLPHAWPSSALGRGTEVNSFRDEQ